MASMNDALLNRKIIGAFASLVVSGASLISFVTSHEGTVNKPYDDVAGIKTVCVGHTGKDIVPGKTYTKEECDNLLKKDLSDHSVKMLQCIKVPVNQNQYDALLSFTFNVGPANFCKSTLLKKLNKEDYTGACDELLKWNMSGGKVYAGLTKRRQDERTLCLKPVSNNGN